jgi:hypothetical protein
MALAPEGHVVVGGEPRAGRSTLVEALFRVLSPNGSRGSLGHDLDFYDRDRSQRAEVEVVLGDLNEELTQRFFDFLEFWDEDECCLIDELDAPDELEDYEKVVRLCYRAKWVDEQEQAEHWVDYPKTADIENEAFTRVRRADLAALPVFFGRAAGVSPLSLSFRGNLREIVDEGDQEDFTDALEAFADHAESLGEDLTESTQLLTALRAVMEPIAPALGIDLDALGEQIGFVPAGIALGALLRALEPTLQLDGKELSLPLDRHGSTAAAILVAAELLVRGGHDDGIVVIDDLGEGVDAATSRHLAAMLRRKAGQVWITTRRAEIAESFKADEVFRLGFDDNGGRSAFQGRAPKSKADRMAARHIALQVLPALTARAVLVLEGPHDRAGLQAVADRRLRMKGIPLPAGHGIALADAGAADSSGGSSAVPRLCRVAHNLGFYTVAVVDGDPGDEDIVEANVAASDAVIRLPDGVAIERALLDGIDSDDIRKALKRLDVELPADFSELDEGPLNKLAVKIMKSRGGLHAEFVDALRGKIPPLAARILDEAISCVAERNAGLHQL